MITNTSLTVEEAARDAGVGSSYASRLLRLAFRAPDIVASIVAPADSPSSSRRMP